MKGRICGACRYSVYFQKRLLCGNEKAEDRGSVVEHSHSCIRWEDERPPQEPTDKFVEKATVERMVSE